MRTTLIFLFSTFCFSICYPQKTGSFSNSDRLFLEGKELYDLQHYSAASQKFNKYLALQTKDRSVFYGQTEFFLASCAYEMGAKDARKKLQNFLANNPNSTYVNDAHYLKGRIHTQKEEYAEAAEEYEYVDDTRFNDEKKHDYLFYSGYACLQNGQNDKAKEKFVSLLKDTTKYQISASYYKAYIDYMDKNYEEALPVFLSMKDEPEYSGIIPYYIFQIQYAQKDYESVLKTGEELIKNNPKNENNHEVCRIMGECYYQKRDYKNTIKYLSQYQNGSEQLMRSNLYMLGIAYYQEGDYVKALDCFQSVTSVEDALGQNAYLYLGSCYTKDQNINNARLCFESAGRMDFDQNIKEEAQYNYALIVYEQAYSPFNESITAFENFLSNFSQSRYKDKVYGYMVNLYTTTKNYEEALKSIEKIEDKSLQIYEARQHITYCMGVQHLNNGDYDKAIQSFTESMKDGKYNRRLEASTIFWRGETYYKQKKFDLASQDFQNFVNMAGARSCDEFNLAHYNIGYTFFTQKDYTTALSWFRKYVEMEEYNKTLIADATNRIGDCYFNHRDFENAAKSYGNVYAMRGPGADYACFQQGFIQGLQKDYTGKIKTLEKLMSTFPQSEYLSDAQYEIGRSYVMMGENQKAIDTYNKLNTDYPHSPLSRKGKLQTAMLYEEMDNLDQASKSYKEIINYFPSSVEAKTAIDGLKNIYFEQNDVQGFADYVGTLNGLVKFDQSEQDSLTYLAAERLYDKGEYERAINGFQNYIVKYPNSYFVNNAHFNMANSYYKIGNMNRAEEEYEHLADKVGSPDREESLVRLSEIRYERKDYNKAIVSMTTLDSIAQRAENKHAARIGLLRCYNILGKLDETIVAATNVITSDKLDPNIIREATFTRAKAYEAKNDSIKAFADYRTISNICMDEYGAEAKYRVADYYFQQNSFDSAEKEIFDFIEINTPHQYWLAKSFILLSDIYMKQNRDFEAKQYLMSVRENYTGKDDISTEISIRLGKIEAKENEKIVND